LSNYGERCGKRCFCREISFDSQLTQEDCVPRACRDGCVIFFCLSFQVMNSNVPVIVNFHADWCDPCKVLTPALRKLVEKTEGLDLAIVDVEQNAELVHTFEVKAVPAVVAIRHGRVVDKFIGLVEADMMEKLVSKLAAMVKKADESSAEA